MDRDALESALRRAWARLQLAVSGPLTRATVEHELEAAARAAFGGRFRFVPDPHRVTDATPARMAALRPRMALVHGDGESPRARPSEQCDPEPEAS